VSSTSSETGVNLTESTSGSGAADEVPVEVVEIQEPPENPPELEVQNVSEDCLVLKEQIRRLQNKVKTLKGHLTKRKLEQRRQSRKGKNQTQITCLFMRTQVAH